ncbi:MAG: hypothetical protein RR533_09525, partial [Carnobacterium sp.]
GNVPVSKNSLVIIKSSDKANGKINAREELISYETEKPVVETVEPIEETKVEEPVTEVAETVEAQSTLEETKESEEA